MKPILFNTPMTRAILAGRKTQTRRVMKPPKGIDDVFGHMDECKQPFMTGDVLYVRETWGRTFYAAASMPKFVYRASDPEWGEHAGWKWHPSIHMPREAARLFLRVTDVRVERLQDMTIRDLISEGGAGYMDIPYSASKRFDEFKDIWDRTIKPSDRDRFGWNANPWVWVISFERITREEAEAALREEGAE